MIKRAAVLVVLLALVSGLVPLVGTPSQSGAAAIVAGRVHETFNPSRGKIFVLVIGNDARAGNPDASRADAIHIVGINTKTMKGGILNFPRDSYLPVPGLGSSKITEALYFGGPDAVAQTLENVTGIHLDYWVMTGFEGFENIIDELGRVWMHMPTAVHDPGGSGAAIPAGTQALAPHSALAYVRTRKAFSSGDFARTTNQATFLLALLRKLHNDVDCNPASLLKWVAATRKHTRFDVPGEELFRLGVLASQLEAEDVGSVTVPGSTGYAGAASVVFVSPSARSTYARFRRTATLPGGRELHGKRGGEVRCR